MENKEGWTWLINSRKWHYFGVEKHERSLCKKFMLLKLPDDLKQGKIDSPDNCAACRRKLIALQKKRGAKNERP